MSISTNNPKAARAYVPTTALAQTATCTDDTLQIFLTDGRTLGVPLLWSPRLFAATPAQRENIEIGGGGLSLHWPDIDEDLSVAGLMAGGDWRST